MKRVQNSSWSLILALTMMKYVGFWPPRNLEGTKKILSNTYTVCASIALVDRAVTHGLYIITQTIELFKVWGDISLMTSASFLLLTNVVLGLKMINVLWRREAIQSIVDESDAVLRNERNAEGIIALKIIDRQTSHLLYSFIFLSGVTAFGWGASAQPHHLPLQAWYPYDESKSPAFEITYVYQVVAVSICAALNISLDTLVTSSIAQCRSRFKLLEISLRMLCRDVVVKEQWVLSPKQEKLVLHRLRECIDEHQAALATVIKIQENFSEPLFAQFIVSIFIICVTAYQLVFETTNTVRLISMLAYLLVMMLQVFLFCYQGNELSVQSTNLVVAAYLCPWYACSVKLRRLLLLLMTRSIRVSRITAGGITTLSLSAFMAIIKASYTFFTVLQQMRDRK